LCEACDHTYFTSERSITAQDYEESNKYADYYSGDPPYLWYHKHALKVTKSIAQEARVLDFGCYDGFFVKRMLDNGIDAYGCDWNREALAAGGKKFGIADRLMHDAEGSFDAITSLEVIEHFEDPNIFMGLVTGLLKDSGQLILSCPNKNSAYRPSTDAPPHHFSRFSANSLATLIGRYGYDVRVHKVEYSFLQMLRNYAGDRMRSASTNIDGDVERKDVENGLLYITLRQMANKIIPTLNALSMPMNIGMWALGKPYIAQFLVAKKRSMSK